VTGILEMKDFLSKLDEYDKVLCGGSNEHTDRVLLTIPDFSLCNKQGTVNLFIFVDVNFSDLKILFRGY